MCGIAGALTLNHKSVDLKACEQMVEKLSHRGPDDAGYLYFHTGCRHKGLSFHLNLSDKRFTQFAPLLPDVQDAPVQRELSRHDWDLFLGHRRLAILDLTEAGHQPMSDLSQNLWVVYNGEIYNFPELRNYLEQKRYSFQSHTDTEVIIYAYAEWGIECVEKFNGMFSFALYDNFRHRLYLVRDRYGIKPLYYAVVRDDEGWTLLFASEVKAFFKYRNFNAWIDYDGFVEYFTFQNFFSDRTLWADVKALLPGHYMEIDLEGAGDASFSMDSRHASLLSGADRLKQAVEESGLKCLIKQYWDFDLTGEKFRDDETDLVHKLEEVFESSVRRQLISDVEIGSYLSGGMDSGSITALSSKYFRDRDGAFKTFTIGFDLHSASGLELSFDEREKAEHMSYLFGTEHYEMVLKAGDMERCLSELVYHLEEPRVGQSYPNFYASLLASRFVKVVLSGCGGDELFGGYPWRYYRALDATDFDDFIMKYYTFWQRLLPPECINAAFAPIRNRVDIEPLEVFRQVFPEGMRPTRPSVEEIVELSLYFEAKTFLHGLLVVEDKLSMTHSLETRVPFLDNEIVDFALKVPVHMKLRIKEKIEVDENLPLPPDKYQRTSDGKLILRKMMRKYVPEDIVTATKQGFSAPDRSWFRGESIELVKHTLLRKDAFIYNLLDRNTITTLIEDHLQGRVNHRLLLWSLLNVEYLYRKFWADRAEEN